MLNLAKSISLRLNWQTGACLLLGLVLQAGCATRTLQSNRSDLVKEVQIGPEETTMVRLSFEVLKTDATKANATGNGDAQAADSEHDRPEPGEQDPPLTNLVGYVVLTSQGAEVQRIEHDFGVNAQQLLGPSWVRLEDLSGDGWMELVLPRQERDGDLSDVVYTYNTQRKRYERTSALSHQGTVRSLAPGCVLLEINTGAQTLCHLPAARRWVRLYASAAATLAGAKVGELEATCVGPGSRLADCRQLRLQTDRSLQSALAALKQQQREQVQQAHGRPTATRVLANLDAGHRAWLNYRDNRCMGHAREQGLAGEGLQMVFESCRYQMALQQTVEYGQP